MAERMGYTENNLPGRPTFGPPDNPARSRRPLRVVVLVVVIGAVLIWGTAKGLSFHWLRRLTQADRDATAELDRKFAGQRAEFRKHQDEEMRGDKSPLARIDYIHLQPGDNRVGAGADAQVRLAAESLAPYAGDLHLIVDARPVAETGAGTLHLRASPAVRVTASDDTSAEMTDGDVHKQDLIALGRLRLLVSGLPAEPAVAVYDPQAPAQKSYQGLHYYPDDSHYVVLARLERYPTPKVVRVEASRGGPQQMPALGVLRFEVNGTPCAMEAYAPGDDPGQLFLIFKDQTNGQKDGSYGAGRFLYARVSPGDQVILDFNQAWNPLCAYSHYFHCPLPPKSNWLPVSLPVGEKAYGEH